MPQVEVDGVKLQCEVVGTGEPLLLIMGLGGQLTDWPPDFVDLLAEQFTVIRFDNRDSGLSTIFDHPAPSRWQLIAGNLRPSLVDAAYTLSDMAGDALGVISALGGGRCHVVGMSMGGMIAQRLAIDHPTAVRSLCSIMSHPGGRRAGRPSARVLAALARRGQPQRDQALDVTLDLFRRVGGADWDESAQRKRSSFSLQRSYNPAGVLRQSQAITVSPDRTADLAHLQTPSLIVHGLDDTLVQPSGGIATAQAIAGSRLILYPRMGHDIPATRHHELAQAIHTNAARAD